MKEIVLKTKRLMLSPMSDQQMEELIDKTEALELKQAYTEMLAGCKKDPQNRLWYTAWKITLKKDDSVFIGDACFKGPQEKGIVEIGYGINPGYENNGYMTEAVRVLKEWAFSQKDVYVIYAETMPDNVASQRVLQKLDFKPCGEGKEGIGFRAEKPATSWMSIYMCFGISIGMSLGAMNDNASIGMCMGIAFGMMIGVLMDQMEKKHREEILNPKQANE